MGRELADGYEAIVGDATIDVAYKDTFKIAM
jgi:hypothetical protein